MNILIGLFLATLFVTMLLGTVNALIFLVKNLVEDFFDLKEMIERRK